jgi:site-specific DNA recombinase
MPSSSGHGSGEATERVALYLRVSSEEQRDRETIEIQDEFLRQYCELYGLESAGAYADDGVSGTIPLHERPEGRRLLEDARAGAFGSVLVSKLDRLGRRLLVIVDAHDRLDDLGVCLRSGREPIDTSTPSGRLIFQMLASFAEYDRENIRERTQAGLHRAFRAGKYMGRVPYGYRADEDARLEIVPEEAEVVREIIRNVAEGSTLYAEAKRLDDLGVPGAGHRYGSRERVPGRRWTTTTIGGIVRQRAYSGTHEVRIGGDVIEREVPAIVSPKLQERARATLRENKRRPYREGNRRYLLAGLVRCETCGYGCSGHATWGKGKRYSYYSCITNKPGRAVRIAPHRAPYVRAEWLEGTVWADVRGFLENPGEVLERVKEQIGGDDDTGELEVRREDLEKRLAAKQAEKDRYVRLYAQGHLSEAELDVYLVDLRNQTENLRLLAGSVEADLSQKREQREFAETTHAWLVTLRERLSEVEAETEDAYRARRRLVELLVAGIMVGRKEDGSPKIEITYRFGPPCADTGEGDVEEMSVGSARNALSYSLPQTSH